MSPYTIDPLHSPDFKHLMGSWSVDMEKSLGLDRRLQNELKRNSEAMESLLMEIHLSPGKIVMLKQGTPLLDSDATFHKLADNEFVVQTQGELSKFMQAWREVKFTIQPDGGALASLAGGGTPYVMVKGSRMKGEVRIW